MTKKRYALIILGWILLWELAAHLIHNGILLAGPVETGLCLFAMMGTAEFWLSLLFSFLRISGGFFLGGLLGMLLAALAMRVPLVKDILSPAMRVLKSVPVASFVILLLIWAGSRFVSFFVSLLVVLPILYVNVLAGLQNADRSLYEVTIIFPVSGLSKLRYYYLPELKGALQGALSLAAGMGYKSGVAAEVIGQPLASIGNGMYRAKIYLATDELFAWTISVVVMAVVFEKVILYLFQCLYRNGGKMGKEIVE